MANNNDQISRVMRSKEEAKFKILDTARMSYWGIPVEIVVAQKP